MVEINSELLARIYPLNKLSERGLTELAPGMRIRSLPARHKLFSVADKPDDYSYLLSGTLQLVDDTETEFETLIPNESTDMVPLPPAIPSLHRGEAVTDIRILSVNRERLAAVLGRELPGSAFSTEMSYSQARGNEDWRQAFLRARGLLRIGGQNLMALLDRMEPLEVKAGEELMRQGEVADAFFVIATGRCEVVRTFPLHGRVVPIAEYGPGATIGEDALISNSPRNATVRMLTDGSVMRLGAGDFRELLMGLLRGVSYEEARAMVEGGARWLDVRMPEEAQGRRLPQSLCIPHPMARARLFTTDPDVSYVCVCASGRDSAVIAFTLCKYDIDAVYLEGGFAQVPASALVQN